MVSRPNVGKTISAIRLLVKKAHDQMRASRALILTDEYRQAFPHLNMALESLGRIWIFIELLGVPDNELENFLKRDQGGAAHKNRLEGACRLFQFFINRRAGKQVNIAATKKIIFSSKLTKEWAFYIEKIEDEFTDLSQSFRRKTLIDEYCLIYCLLDECEKFVGTLSPHFVSTLGKVMYAGREKRR